MSLVDCKVVYPYTKELIERCGTAQRAAFYSGIAVSTMYRVMYQQHCTLQEETARKILLALIDKRREDRKQHTVSREFRVAKYHQARMEEQLERMVGY